MSIEVGVVIGFDNNPLFWHLPEGRTAGSIPDSRQLWDVLWDNRATVYGFAHSHPGKGFPYPSQEDVTTFSAIELALGRRLIWWITSFDEVSITLWVGPGLYGYETYQVDAAYLGWLMELRKRSA